MEERLQKIMARAGLTSRREAEQWILAGRVTVNGITTRELGSKADPDRDQIRVDGKLLNAALESVYILLHKPEGFVTTTRDPEGRPTVMNLVKRVRTRVYPVGRLDYDTSGILILTSDGELTRFLTHPSSRVPKTYQVKVKGKLRPEAVKALREGPRIGGPRLKPAEAVMLKPTRTGLHSWLRITITEGRTRQVRRMCEAVGHPALKLKRVAIGPLLLGRLPVGEWRYLTDREVAALKRLMPKGPPLKRPKKRGRGR